MNSNYLPNNEIQSEEIVDDEINVAKTANSTADKRAKMALDHSPQIWRGP